MFRNYLKTALRTFWKDRTFAAINVTGLTIGITASVLLLLWVQDELSFDRFHRHARNTYRVVSVPKEGDGGGYNNTAALAPFAQREIPEIEEAVRVYQNWRTYLFTYGDKSLTQSNSAYVDASFFKLFDFQFVRGSAARPFPTTQSIIITETVARKYFGTEDPLGKTIQADQKDNYVVSGVIRDMPSNTQFQYEVFYSFAYLIQNYRANIYWKTMETDWGNWGYDTYFRLHPDASSEEVSAKLSQIYRRNQPYDHSTIIKLRALPQVHLVAADGSTGAQQLVRIFLAVGVLVLLIACINYVNLATARAAERAKEVGVRKLVGAGRGQLFAQFLGESALIVFLSVVLARVFMQLLIPVYNELSGKNLSLQFSNLSLLWLLGGITLAALLVAGMYPALLLSSFRPLEAVKGKLKLGSGSVSFREVLVVSQFSFSIALIIGTLVISRQLSFIREKELGYEKENVFSFWMRGDMGKRYETIRTELLRQPGVAEVTVSNGDLLYMGNSTGDTDWDGKEEKRMFVINTMSIDRNFMDMFKMKLVAGKGFTGTPADSTHYILNETAVREMGLKDPVGKRFKLWLTEGTIVGVAKDFHFRPAHEKIEPAVFYYRPDQNAKIYVKTTGAEAAGAIATAGKIWKAFNPAYPFEYRFMDESYDQMYKSDQRTGKLFTYFAGMAILISCLGLFGLAAFTAGQRTKEIGIRKVLGASVGSITLLLSKDFLRLVLVSILIASPVAWYVMNQWLGNFAYKIGIGAWMFVVAGGLGLCIALATVSFQAIKAALANPVKSLRNE